MPTPRILSALLILASSFATGCIDPDGFADGDYASGRYGPSVASEIETIAVGGSMLVEVDGNDSVNALLSVEEGPFVVIDVSQGERDRTFVVQAVGTGNGRLRLYADGFLATELNVSAREVETIETVPMTDYGWQGTTDFAVAYDSPEIAVALLSSDGERLHDDSLSIEVGDDVTQIGWNQFSIALGKFGTVPFTVAGDSFGSRLLVANVAVSVDRFEVVSFPAERVGGNNQIVEYTVCFYAFAGDLQVMTNIDISVQGPATEWGSPCTKVRPTGRGQVVLRAAAMDLVETHELVR